MGEYILAQVEFVYNMARSDSLSCPFQVDACIAYNDAKMSEKTLAALPNDGDDDEDSDDEDEQKAFEFEDCFGNVKKKLSSEKLVHSVGEFGAETRSRFYRTQFEKFKEDLTSINEADKEYR